MNIFDLADTLIDRYNLDIEKNDMYSLISDIQNNGFTSEGTYNQKHTIESEHIMYDKETGRIVAVFYNKEDLDRATFNVQPYI